jgi:hypothetical protein
MNADLLKILSARFEQHPERHPGLPWSSVQQRLLAGPERLRSLGAMEESGGQPDLVCMNDAWLYVDCSPESPAGRRSLCYDAQALAERKENKPVHSAVQRAAEMGLELLDEDQYRHLQTLGRFDCKTSSWIHTPAKIRKLGGALFGDRRYETVFIYHNGAQSYYAARGFRAFLRV